MGVVEAILKGPPCGPFLNTRGGGGACSNELKWLADQTGAIL